MKRTLSLIIGLAFNMAWLHAQPEPGTQPRPASDVETLIAVLKEKRTFSERPALAADTITELGRIRATEAIPLLIENIDFYDNRTVHTGLRPHSILDGRPCVDALINIGNPSVQPVLEATKKEDQRVRRICMAAVLYEIHVRDGSNVLPLIESAIAEAKDQHVKTRLEKVKQYVVNPAKATRGNLNPDTEKGSGASTK